MAQLTDWEAQSNSSYFYPDILSAEFEVPYGRKGVARGNQKLRIEVEEKTGAIKAFMIPPINVDTSSYSSLGRTRVTDQVVDQEINILYLSSDTRTPNNDGQDFVNKALLRQITTNLDTDIFNIFGDAATEALYSYIRKQVKNGDASQEETEFFNSLKQKANYSRLFSKDQKKQKKDKKNSENTEKDNTQEDPDGEDGDFSKFKKRWKESDSDKLKEYVWFNGFKMDLSIDSSSGAARIRAADSSGTKYAGDTFAYNPQANDNSVWEFSALNKMYKLYSNSMLEQAKPIPTKDEFEEIFYNEIIPKVDKKRANVLNEQAGILKEKRKKEEESIPDPTVTSDSVSKTQRDRDDNSDPNNNPFKLFNDLQFSFDEVFKTFFDNNTPGASDPNSGREVNSNGEKTNTKVEGEATNTLETGNFDNFLNNFTSDLPPIPQSTSGDGSMRYPLQQLPNLDYDFVKFTANLYVPSGLKLDNYDTKNKNVGDEQGSVVLPCIPAQEDNSVGFGPDNLNALEMTGAEAAMNMMQGTGEALTGSFKKAGEAFNTAVGNISDLVKRVEQDGNNATDAAKAFFAGQILNKNVMARATGMVMNNNLELLFTGPELRSFNFNFILVPRDEDEAQMIKSIIRFFKKNMRPIRTPSNIFLKSPNIFKIEYKKGDQEHPFLNHIKPCFLTNFSVNYRPQSTYNTYFDGSMTAYEISFTMGEVEPIYQDDEAEGMGF